MNSTTIPSSQYTVNDNGSTSPEVVFHNPTPGAPAAGDDVCVYATSERGDNEATGTLDW